MSEMDHLLDELHYNGPKRFTADRLAAEEDLFAVRAALVYTPTSRVPTSWIGSGHLDVSQSQQRKYADTCRDVVPT